jgi:hypothetical protein
MSGSDVAERPLRLGNGIAYRWLEDCPICFPHERGKKVQRVVAQIPWRSDLFDSHWSLPTVKEIETELTREDDAQ